MPINHKFLNTNWGNGFQSTNAILTITPYEPEVLFIGTFNPNTNGNHNLANFFYGRDNYLFPMLHGIFNLGTIHNQLPPYDNIIWPICTKLKLSFADLIKSVFPNQIIGLTPNSNNVIFNGSNFNLLKDNDLLKLDDLYNEVVWNEENIIKFIKKTPTLKHIYITQKSNNEFLNRYNIIKENCARSNLSFRCIYTPSGQSLSGVPRELYLAMQWLIEQNDGSGFNIDFLHLHNVNSFTYNKYTLNF
ncbi:MAG: hypothetical protein RLZ10_5 [Bacteroidota bacterium]|jgi:hypothetical protein